MPIGELYQEIILDHDRKPRNAGVLDAPKVEVHHFNPVCGDELTLGLRLQDGRVAAVAVEATGCAISRAAASVMTEQVLGRPLDEGLAVGETFRRMLRGEAEGDEDILGDGIAFGGVARYPVRVKCALLGWMAFKDAAVRATGDRDGGADGD